VLFGQKKDDAISRANKGRIQALIIGTNYDELGANYKLNYAENDAKVFHEFLIKSIGVKDENVALLSGGNVTHGSIAHELAKISEKCTKVLSPIIVIYFSGHGKLLRANDKLNYKLLIPGKEKKLLAPIFNYDILELWGMLRFFSEDLDARVIVVLDACYSGQSIKLIKKKKPENVILLCSSGSGETSYEAPSWRYGFFSYMFWAFTNKAQGSFNARDFKDFIQLCYAYQGKNAPSPSFFVAEGMQDSLIIGHNLNNDTIITKFVLPDLPKAIDSIRDQQISKAIKAEYVGIQYFKKEAIDVIRRNGFLSAKVNIEDLKSVILGFNIDLSIALKYKYAVYGTPDSLNPVLMDYAVEYFPKVASFFEKNSFYSFHSQAINGNWLLFKCLKFRRENRPLPSELINAMEKAWARQHDFLLAYELGNYYHNEKKDRLKAKFYYTDAIQNEPFFMLPYTPLALLYKESDSTMHANIQRRLRDVNIISQRNPVEQYTLTAQWYVSGNYFDSTAQNTPRFKELIDDNIAITMVRVEGDSFMMGCDGNDPERKRIKCNDNEIPLHPVKLSSYYIGATEVTQAQWKAIMGNNPSKHKDCDECPVENVSWVDANNFIQKLNELTGKKYRLPTEAEWEFAAKGGRLSGGFVYAGSNDIDTVAWYGGNSADSTHVVGLKMPNELGLFDMIGNVQEWVFDVMGTYSPDMQINPQRPLVPGVMQVLRGGSAASLPRFLYNSSRNGRTENVTAADIGFRLAL
jgi:formylglycine-generating enzyme required for sulfatase activity